VWAQSTSDSSNSATPPAKADTKLQVQNDAQTIKGLNSVPGVDVKQSSLSTSPELPPIKGFHPIKRALRPVVQLERNSVDLQKQIMRLEGPIAGLQTPMVRLQKKMGSVEDQMGSMQKTISSTQEQVSQTGGGVANVSKQMTAVRGDLHEMQADINSLRKPITDLEGPLHQLQGPLNSLAQPLTRVDKELADMKALLQLVLGAIFLATFAIAIGTPIAAVLIYKNRHKIFPQISDHDFPVAKATDKNKEEVRTATRV
jgi:peptidoglycan hydrolase CwlO-like protein